MSNTLMIAMIAMPTAGAIGAIIDGKFGLTVFLAGCALANGGGLMMARGL
jgi:hypothetical protein